MADTASAPPGLSFPRATFAKLTPAPFLQAHLKQPQPIRPSGRKPDELREPVINTGSLSHSNGSAVVRLGDTSVVCGVRGEILLSSEVPHPPNDETRKEDMVEHLGLLVPNVELSTGCSPAYLPGNPPSNSAQSLSWRITSLLQASDLVNSDDLTISYAEPKSADMGPDEEPNLVVKAYWALYIDILCISLDGNCYDAAWMAVMAALKNTTLPNAWWDADHEAVICSPHANEARKLALNGSPSATTFAVFSTASPLKQQSEAESWVLADPDSFEEDVCNETVTVAIEDGKILRIEKHGGARVGKEALASCVSVATKAWRVLQKLDGSV
jgi:exosome complex component RRP43